MTLQLSSSRIGRAVTTALVLAVLAAPGMGQAPADQVSGVPRVIDADVLRFGGIGVILWGIDAPERSQKCFKDSEIRGCAEAAKRTLELLAGRGEVTCYLVEGEPDPFQRRYGLCESGGVDINAEMVRRGMALAYTEQTEDFLTAQSEAIGAEAGVWALGVEMEAPWDFRRNNTPGGFR